MADVQPADPRQALSEDRVMPGVTYGLYLLGFATGGITTIIGLIVAYARLADAGPVTFSHYRFLIRTFWLSFAWALVGLGFFAFGAPLSLILIGIPFVFLATVIWGAIGIWFAVRCCVGVIYLARGEAYPRPRTWLV
jgi:uncharacterized membrane protein